MHFSKRLTACATDPPEALAPLTELSCAQVIHQQLSAWSPFLIVHHPPQFHAWQVKTKPSCRGGGSPSSAAVSNTRAASAPSCQHTQQLRQPLPCSMGKRNQSPHSSWVLSRTTLTHPKEEPPKATCCWLTLLCHCTQHGEMAMAGNS